MLIFFTVSILLEPPPSSLLRESLHINHKNICEPTIWKMGSSDKPCYRKGSVLSFWDPCAAKPAYMQMLGRL